MAVENTLHPCGAVGIAEVDILVPGDKRKNYAELYSVIAQTEKVEMGDHMMPLEVPMDGPEGKPCLRVIGSESEVHNRRLRHFGPGIVSLVIYVTGEGGKATLCRGPAIGPEDFAIYWKTVR